MKPLTIGKLAKACNSKIDTICYYERINLIQPKGRTKNGYRFYNQESIRRINFIKKAKTLGFKLEEILDLLNLQSSDIATARDVLELTQAKIAELKLKCEELNAVRIILEDLTNACPGEGPTSDCQILDYMYPKDQEI